jgi:hypothetical protein
MVAMCGEGREVATFSVRLLNEELYPLLPEGRLSFTSEDADTLPQLPTAAAKELYVSIRVAVCQYLLSHSSFNA